MIAKTILKTTKAHAAAYAVQETNTIKGMKKVVSIWDLAMTVFCSQRCRPLRQCSKRILLSFSVKLCYTYSNGSLGCPQGLTRQLRIENMRTLLSAKVEIQISG